MKQIAVASGKGGTGKTSMVASFAGFANAVLADCDVDAPNLHLILKPEVAEKIPYEGMEVAEINGDVCIECGACEQACRFNAIEHFHVIAEKCEGCGVCPLVCPVDAIEMKKRVTGHVYIAHTRLGEFVYGLLGAGEEASGKLVTVARKKAVEIAEKAGVPLIIIDAPAGIGCPVIASIGNIDLLVMVVESTMAAIHDMERLLEVAVHFKVNTVAIINKYDINEVMTERIEDFCRERGIAIVGKIPFSKKFTEAMVREMSVTEYDKELAERVRDVWERIEEYMNASDENHHSV